MKFRYGKILAIAAAIATVVGFGYWYVFVAGAPQLDPPQTNVPNSGMTFRLASFNSQAMGERQYGLILPPGYDRQADKLYPVIFCYTAVMMMRVLG